MRANSGKSTIGGSSNSHSADPRLIPHCEERQYKPVNWENAKLLLAILSPSIANGSNRSRKPPSIVDLPEFKAVLATTACQTPQREGCGTQSHIHSSQALRQLLPKPPPLATEYRHCEDIAPASSGMAILERDGTKQNREQDLHGAQRRRGDRAGKREHI